MLAFGRLEWTFVSVLILLVGAAGLFAAYLVLHEQIHTRFFRPRVHSRIPPTPRASRLSRP